MDSSLHGNFATELAGKAVLADLQEQAALINILQRANPWRALGWRPWAFVVAIVMSGAFEGVTLVSMKAHSYTEYGLSVAAMVGAITGFIGLLLAVKTQRELAAVISLMLRAEARRLSDRTDSQSETTAVATS